MARRCLDVKQLKIYFWCTNEREEKEKLVTEKVSKFLKKYASSTSCHITSKDTVEVNIYPGVIVTVEFSKSISVITMMNFLKFFDATRYLSIVIKEDKKLMEVNI